ncbi:cupin-like domain-containing protein [Lysobacter humi (ex Lee et al. 2017)]
MHAALEPIAARDDVRADAIPDDVLRATQPVLLRGLARDWPAVHAGRASPRAAVDLLRRFDAGRTVGAMVGAPDIGGRFFYDAALTGFNFHMERPPLAAVLEALLRHVDDPAPPALYVGSTTIDEALPGFRAANDLALGARDALASIWIGNRTRIAAHQDVPDNIAVVVAGHRRFTLFPPDCLRDLYIGPLDLTPAGQPISLVDLHAPDFDAYPRFREALARAQVAELGPGDALFIPSLWWHHVEALEAFNVLVNYWWRDAPAHMDSPMAALMLALMTIRDLPHEQREAWREIFRHYVFEADEATVAHIPPEARRSLAPLDPATARELRARLLKRLNR